VKQHIPFLTVYIVVFFAVPFLSFAQTRVRGVVVDDTRQPVHLATVEIFPSDNPSAKKVITTDERGQFEVVLQPAMYGLRVTFLGYQALEHSSVKISNEATDLGEFHLQLDEQLLEEAVVSHQRKLVEQRSDRLVVNVENSVLSDGLTALEILQHAPGVRVDEDGNMTMRGKAGVRVMINGKLSYLSEKELALLLKGTPSSSIKSIELITNPSARYDAAGNAGLINIVMKTQNRQGINGTVHSFAARGRKERYGGGLHLNVRQNRFNVLSNYDYGYRGEEEYRSFIRQFNHPTRPDSSRVSNQQSETNEPLSTHNAKFGMDYEMSERFSLGALWTGNFGTYKNLSEGYNNISFLDGRLASNALTDNTQESRWNTQGVNVNLLKKIGSRNHELSADFDYTYADYSANQYLLSDFQQTDFQPAFRSIRRGQTPSTTYLYVGKSDYVHHISDGQKLEVGWKSSWITADNNAVNDTLRQDQWVIDENTSNHFNYEEQIHAAYVNYSLERKLWNVMAGLRMENTHTVGNQLTANHRVERRYTQLFPSVSVAYKPNATHTVQFSYSKRIQRPDYEDLNPFRYYVDAFVFWEGNPQLQPELAHSFELTYLFGGDLGISLYYTHIDDVITSVLTQLPEQNVTIRSIDNIERFSNVGVNINYTLKPLPFWTSVNNVNGFNNSYLGAYNGEAIDNQSWSATFNSTNTFAFGKGISAEINGEYNTARVDGVLRLNAYGAVSAGVMKKLLQDKLTLKLAVSDIFRTINYNPRSTVDGVDMYQQFDLDSRVGTFSVSFRFGQETNRRERRSGSEDEQQRIRGGG